MKCNSLADVLVYVDGVIAQNLATFASDLRSRGPADGLTPDAIEEAIEFALEESEKSRESARQQIAAEMASFNNEPEMNLTTPADAIAQIEGATAEFVGEFVRNLRATARAEGLGDEAIEQAIDHVLGEAELALKPARARIVAMFNHINDKRA